MISGLKIKIRVKRVAKPVRARYKSRMAPKVNDLINRKPEGKRGKVGLIRKLKVENPSFSQGQIARVAGCDKALVSRELKKFSESLTSPAELNDWKVTKADRLEELGMRLIKSADEEAIAKSSLLQRITAYGIIEDKLRLHLGLATSINVNVLLDAANRLAEHREKDRIIEADVIQSQTCDDSKDPSS
jgi:hypothetical protein